MTSQLLTISYEKLFAPVYYQAWNDIFDGKFELRVHDREDVKTIIDNLKQVSGLQEVSQIM